MNSPSIRPSAAVSAALLVFAFVAAPVPAPASLADHPEPAKLDPPAPPAAAMPPAAPAMPAPPAKTPPVHKPNPAAGRSAADREEILSLARKGLLDSALSVCKPALAGDPENPFLLLMMGKLSPDGKESAGYFKKAIKSGGTSPEAEESLFRLGQFHYAAGKYYLAIPFFRDYLRLYPAGDWKQPAQYWMGNACLSLAQGRPDRLAYLDSGAVWFQKMLDGSKPEDYYHPLALEGLAKAKAAMGDRDGAWQAASTALEKAPEEEQSPLLLLAAQLRQGVDRGEEKSLMARLVGRYPQSPEARYLRKLNAGVDTSRWKSGSGLPRPALPPAKDSLAMAPKVPEPGPADSLRKATETPTLPNPGGAAGYTLQLGAFSQAANARAMMASLAKLGLSPELLESSRGGKPIYQVRLGRFATAEEASEYARLNLKPKKFLSQPVQLTR
ncbi:MAG TPA: SPOR domain-containing protein [Fibrobacteria bacterium]|nr:SPOR domain-containing protein [Fibrobacteria bacterium]